MREQSSVGLEAGLLQHKQSVEVYVRHTKSCPHRSAGRQFRKCQCPKWLYIYKDGQGKRLSSKTGSWVKAEKQAQEIRDSWVPEFIELKRLRAEKELARIEISAAVEIYINDMKVRNQAKLTVSNARCLFQSETNALSLVSWIAKYNAPKVEDLRLAFLDQIDGTILSQWRSEWKGAPLTLRNRWSRVVSFFNWFFRTGKIQRHPCMGLKNFSAEEGTTIPLSAIHFEYLLASVGKVPLPKNVDRMTRESWRPRLRALLLVMRWLGLAISDAAGLKRSELVYDDETGHWCVDTDRQKTGVPVYVPLPNEVYRELINFHASSGESQHHRFLQWR